MLLNLSHYATRKTSANAPFRFSCGDQRFFQTPKLAQPSHLALSHSTFRAVCHVFSNGRMCQSRSKHMESDVSIFLFKKKAIWHPECLKHHFQRLLLKEQVLQFHSEWVWDTLWFRSCNRKKQQLK